MDKEKHHLSTLTKSLPTVKKRKIPFRDIWPFSELYDHRKPCFVFDHGFAETRDSGGVRACGYHKVANGELNLLHFSTVINVKQCGGHERQIDLALAPKTYRWI